MNENEVGHVSICTVPTVLSPIFSALSSSSTVIVCWCIISKTKCKDACVHALNSWVCWHWKFPVLSEAIFAGWACRTAIPEQTKRYFFPFLQKLLAEFCHLELGTWILHSVLCTKFSLSPKLFIPRPINFLNYVSRCYIHNSCRHRKWPSISV